MNAPDRLYKFFTQEQHALSLLDHGAIRLGTLYEFRALDGWDAVRGDHKEGEFTFSLESARPETLTRDSAPWFIKPIIERLGTPILSHGGVLNAVANHPDAYIYCTTDSRSSEAVAAYGAHVVEIHDVQRYFTALTAHLTDALGVVSHEPHGYLAPCLYRERSVTLRSSTDPVNEPPLAFIKPADRHAEKEVRAIWHPSVPRVLEPLYVMCPDLASCCRPAR